MWRVVGAAAAALALAGCGSNANSQTAYVTCDGFINIGCGVRQYVMPNVDAYGLALFLLALVIVLGGLYVILSLAGMGHREQG